MGYVTVTVAQCLVFMGVNKPSGMFITTTATSRRNLVNKPRTSSSRGLSLFTVMNTQHCAMTRGNIRYRNRFKVENILTTHMVCNCLIASSSIGNSYSGYS